MFVRRRMERGLVVAAAVVLGACGNETSPNVLDPKGDEARQLADIWWLMFGMAGAVYAVVAGLIVFAIVRGRREGAEPSASRLNDNAFVVIGGLLVPLGILMVVAFVTVRGTVDVRQPERGALRLDVRAQNWWWEVRYPATGIVTANEIHVPVGRQVAVRIRTADVIHSFWVPQLAGKLDAIPGQDNVLRFTAEKAGVYRGQCAEFCGIQHAVMKASVEAMPRPEFEAWLEREAQAQEAGTSGLGEATFTGACAKCHGLAGEGDIGPRLRGNALLADANAVEKVVRDGRRAMPPVGTDWSDRQMDALTAYLEEELLGGR